ncbi:aminotransferase class IV [Mesorhizobium sp. ANAO-SY3R2]|uniref:aminotransferase class IV n=1 Tax=Mesorhizobium sp. ANAO-SY3R2 TaxID=3166644 RepID=UPI00366C8971
MGVQRIAAELEKPTQEAPLKGAAYVDGKFVPMADAKISVFDYGFMRSDVTYDVVHVWDGHFFRLDHHIKRFTRSVSELRMKLPVTETELRAILEECVIRCGTADAFVAMLCTRGRPPQGSRDLRLCENRLIAYAVPFIWIFGAKRNLQGVTAIISSVPRIPPESVDPTVKNYHWLDLDRSVFEAYDHGADTAILLGMDGNVAEGVGFNVFAVAKGRLITPDRGMLLGITRQTVIDICAENGIPVEIRPISKEEFVQADEIFTATTAGGISPIVKIDDRVLGDGLAGPMTTRIHDLYWERHEKSDERTPIAYRSPPVRSA